MIVGQLKIRTRLTMVFSLIFGTLLILSVTLLYLRMSRSLHKDFRSEMIHDGRIVAELFKEELKLNALQELGEEIKEFGIEMQVLDVGGRVMVQSDGWSRLGVHVDEALLSEIHDGYSFKDIRVDGQPMVLFGRLIHIPGSDPYSLHIVRSREHFEKILSKLFSLMLLIVPFMILLAGIAGYFFSTNALASVDHIRKEADQIYVEDLSKRLPIPRQKDELGLLSETLNRMLDRIQNSFEKLKRFTADASHELRIPLTALRGNLEVALRKERSSQEYKETIRDALVEAEHLSQLSQDLLLLAQGDAGQRSLNIQPVRLDIFMEDIFSQSNALANDKTVAIKLKPVPPVEVRMDPDRMRQMLLNLIDNALKYNRPGGEVRLSAAVDEKNIRFDVEDNGIGIPESETDKIFERFYRVDKSRSRELGGAGLGLSIVRWIVEAHQGRIEVSSRLGEGTIFSIVIPPC